MSARATGLVRTLLVGIVLLAGCGISEDGAPQVIGEGELPPDLLSEPSTTTTLPPSQTVPVTIYLLRQSSEGPVLVPVERDVSDPGDAGQRIRAVLGAQPTPQEQARGLVSAIPPDVELLDAPQNRETRELTIDLSGELFTIRGETLSSAFAQIVYTAAELQGVRTVRFRIDGEPQQALDAAGAQQTAVDTSDYASMAPK